MINKEIHAPMEAFFGMFCYAAETILFVIAGLIMGFEISENLTAMRLGILFFIYIMAHISRFVVIMACYPVLSKFGYSWDIKKVLLLTWGGLRGAVGLCIALMLFEEKEGFSEQYRKHVLFYTSGLVLLTLVVNGPTTSFVMDKLGFNRLSHIRTTKLHMAVEDIMKVYSKEKESRCLHNHIYSYMLDEDDVIHNELVKLLLTKQQIKENQDKTLRLKSIWKQNQH